MAAQVKGQGRIAPCVQGRVLHLPGQVVAASTMQQNMGATFDGAAVLDAYGGPVEFVITYEVIVTGP